MFDRFKAYMEREFLPLMLTQISAGQVEAKKADPPIFNSTAVESTSGEKETGGNSSAASSDGSQQTGQTLTQQAIGLLMHKNYRVSSSFVRKSAARKSLLCATA